jgi:hypothetical protein
MSETCCDVGKFVVSVVQCKLHNDFGCHNSEHSSGHIAVKNYCIIISNIFVESSCNTLSYKSKFSLSKI